MAADTHAHTRQYVRILWTDRYTPSAHVCGNENGQEMSKMKAIRKNAISFENKRPAKNVARTGRRGGGGCRESTGKIVDKEKKNIYVYASH